MTSIALIVADSVAFTCPPHAIDAEGPEPARRVPEVPREQTVRG